MAVNSPEPTLLCVCLSSFYNQDVPLLDFIVLFVVIVVVVIVVSNHLLKMDWLVVIPLGTIICIPERGADVSEVSFVRLLTNILRFCFCALSCGESPIYKGLVCHSPSGHYHLPFIWEEQALVECNFHSVLHVTLPSFLLPLPPHS